MIIKNIIFIGTIIFTSISFASDASMSLDLNSKNALSAVQKEFSGNKLKKIKDVKLRKPSCKCFVGNIADEDFKEYIVKRNADFAISEKDPKELCKLGEKIILCSKPGPCYRWKSKVYKECSMPAYNQLVCPKECVSYKVTN